MDFKYFFVIFFTVSTMLKVVVCIVLFICLPVWCACPGACQPNTYPCPGNYLSGYCPGGNNIQCCEGNISDDFII